MGRPLLGQNCQPPVVLVWDQSCWCGTSAHGLFSVRSYRCRFVRSGASDGFYTGLVCTYIWEFWGLTNLHQNTAAWPRCICLQS